MGGIVFRFVPAATDAGFHVENVLILCACLPIYQVLQHSGGRNESLLEPRVIHGVVFDSDFDPLLLSLYRFMVVRVAQGYVLDVSLALDLKSVYVSWC